MFKCCPQHYCLVCGLVQTAKTSMSEKKEISCFVFEDTPPTLKQSPQKCWNQSDHFVMNALIVWQPMST